MLLLCAATGVESRRLEAVLGGLEGTLFGRDVAILRTGFGPVSAAIEVTRFLAAERADAIVNVGIAGAYPASGLSVGDVACAETEQYGDLGAETPDGFLEARALGHPMPAMRLDLFPAKRRAPFVTVSTCTGTDARARAIAERTGGAVESMEGAAVVQAALAHGIPVGEVRGVSNAVGDRDRDAWRIEEAAEAAQEAVLRWIEAGC